MFFLGLVLPICYVAGYTGAAIPTQLAALSVLLLPNLWKGEATPIHWLGLLFLAFASLSMIWTLDYGLGLWVAFIWGLSLWYGTTEPDLTELWQGLAIGMAINSAIAVIQALGYHPVAISTGTPGLLFNTVLLGATSALVIVALVCNRLWWYIPGVMPALWLSHSRSAWVVLAAALIAKYVHWLVAVGIIVVGGVAFWVELVPSDLMRLQFWRIAIDHMSFFGNGVGAFNAIYLVYKAGLVHAENVHNDYLQLAFEFGIFALIPIGILAAALYRDEDKNWPVLFAFAVLGLFYFPLWSATTAFIGCVVAGNILRGNDPLCGLFDRGRFSVFLWRIG